MIWKVYKKIILEKKLKRWKNIKLSLNQVGFIVDNLPHFVEL